MTDAPRWYQYGLDHPGSPGDVDVDGTRIHYETWGPDAGRPDAGGPDPGRPDPGRPDPDSTPGVVLIHGSNAHLSWWRFVAPYLARKYRVAALDLSGNGDSGHRAGYSGPQFADEVWSVCEAAGLGPRPFVIGHSFGGFVALETAHRYDERLGGVIFNDFTVRPPEDYVEWGRRAEREGRTEPRQLRIYDDLDTAVGRFRLVPEQPPLNPAVHRWLAERSLKQVESGWTWRFDPGLFDHMEMGIDQREKFASLQCRSGVVLGEHSADDGARSGPYMHKITRGLLPIITVPDTHHHMMFEEPLALTMAFEGLIDSWIAEDGRAEMRDALSEISGSHD